MKIASVIVDVPAMQTDKLFDYLVPEKWENTILPGMRVIVPFGPRKIQGFVTALKADSEVEHLRAIIEPQDLVPVLNGELLALGDWLAEETLCLKISAYQVMLPAAMKAKYEKSIRRLDHQANPLLDEMFGNKEEISWKEAEARNILPSLQKEVKNGSAEVVYAVKSKANKKMVRMISSPLSLDELNEKIGTIPGNAVKQKQLLQFFLVHPGAAVPAPELAKTADASSAAIKALIEKGWLREKRKELYRDPYEHSTFQKSDPHVLTTDQKQAIQPVLSSIRENRSETFLLYGVTGSGKTEIYLQSIQAVLNEGKEAIVLVPEISLTPQMVHRFKSRFGKDVAVLHSGLSIGEKYDEWRKIIRKEVKVVVGARSAIFAPFENIGMIIIDEEHENSYKQEDNPRYHARDVAIFRSKIHHCPVILGSATPSLESFARAQKNVYTLLRMGKRMNNQPLTDFYIFYNREEIRNGKHTKF
jgi:primosomal protein N' (replication factor Y)